MLSSWMWRICPVFSFRQRFAVQWLVQRETLLSFGSDMSVNDMIIPIGFNNYINLNQPKLAKMNKNTTIGLKARLIAATMMFSILTLDAQVQIGTDINGEAADDRLGRR